MKKIKQLIKELSSQYLNEVINIRRHLHQYPELSNDEYNTAEFICKKLNEYNIPFKDKIAKTGVVGLIQGKKNSNKLKNVALRADMDALPIEEKNEVEYKSKISGKMHACGHDVHIASLLGTSKILKTIENEFSGSVKLIFQPSEEKYPGGAIVMINEGVLENPKPDVIISQHTLPEIEAGRIGIKNGKFMASTDEIYIKVRGKGGHSATPNLNIDCILIASHIVIALQQIVSRNANPITPTVLSFGKFIANGQTNIMPDEVNIAGTLRTFNEGWRKEIHNKIETISRSIAEGMGGECKIFIDSGYPYLTNDEILTDRIRNYSIEYLGNNNIEELDLRMTAEDFAYFSQRLPACMYRLGVGNKKKGITSNLHSSTFDIDEKALETGIGLMTWITLNELNK